MSAAFTPGPWEIEAIPNYQGASALTGATIVGRKGGTSVAEIRGAVNIGIEPHSENDANTRLIAAAPDLYAALKAMSEFWAYGMAKPEGAEPSLSDRQRVEQLAKKAATAIARAEGRT